ncbi:MAG: hypothetical protein HQL84_08290 [Magnetococcales bacterium]|nr:hypothetical protein [Magnetococcales bacterium]
MCYEKDINFSSNFFLGMKKFSVDTDGEEVNFLTLIEWAVEGAISEPQVGKTKNEISIGQMNIRAVRQNIVQGILDPCDNGNLVHETEVVFPTEVIHEKNHVRFEIGKSGECGQGIDPMGVVLFDEDLGFMS